MNPADAPALIPGLRAATVADAPALAALQTGAFDTPWSVPAIVRALEDPGGFALVAGAGDPLGFALVRPTGEDAAELLILVVRPDARRRGYGRALALAAGAVAAASGARALFLEVAEDNPEARALYARLGFREVGVRRAYYRRLAGPRVDARVLRLDL